MAILVLPARLIYRTHTNGRNRNLVLVYDQQRDTYEDSSKSLSSHTIISGKYTDLFRNDVFPNNIYGHSLKSD